MENYKYSVGNVFLLRNILNVVVYVSKEELYCLTNNTNSDGEILSNWTTDKYDLTKKIDLEKLAFLGSNNLPTTKFGQVGSLMVYGVNDYLFLGVVNRTLGNFTFKKPLLLELNKIVTALTTEIEQGNDDLNLVVAQLWDSCTKIPFESDKNISLTLLQEPQLPIRNFTIVEVESAGKPQNQGSGNGEEIMPPLINIRNINIPSRKSNILNKENIIIGVNFSSNAFDMANFATELNFSIVGKKNINSVPYTNENLTIGGLYLTTGRSRNPFILSGKESLFPDWKLDMDNEFLCGDAFSNNDYTILGKVLFFDEPQNKTKFGFGKINYGDAVGNKKYATQFMLWHPQIFQGYNIDFGTSSNDNFLTIKNDLVGLKNGGLSGFLTSKSIGSPTYPIKTRAFLKKNNVTTLNQKIVENKALYDSGTLEWSSDTYTFFPLSYKKNVEDYYVSDQIKRWSIENQFQQTMSWDKFRLISSNTQSKAKESNYLQFFDYGNLNNIQNTNPILFDKLVLLINKATDIYDNLTPVVTQQSSNLNIVEYVGLELHYHQFILYYYDKSKERARISGASLKVREYEIRGTDQINSEIKQLFYDPIYQFMLDNKIFARQADEFNLNGVHIELSKFNQLKNFIRGKYLEIILLSINKNEFYNIETEFSLRVASLASNYFPFQAIETQFGGYGQLFPETTFKLNDLLRFAQNYTSEVRVTNVINLNLTTSRLDEDLKNTIREFLKDLITLSVERYELFLRLKRWANLVQLFGYYEVVKTQVQEVGLSDIHNDIRFKYFLRDSHLLGFFTEKDVDELIMYLTQVNNIINKIYFNLNNLEFRFSSSLDLNYYLDFEALGISAFTLEEEFPSNPYYLKSTDKTVAYQFALLKPELYGQKIRETMDMMKEDEVVGRLLTGETTPSQEWYRIFGGEIPVAIIEEEEVIVDVEPSDDFDFDSLDLDDIEIDLSDDEILEDNIDI
jgi:hypothetical protein